MKHAANLAAASLFALALAPTGANAAVRSVNPDGLYQTSTAFPQNDSLSGVRRYQASAAQAARRTDFNALAPFGFSVSQGSGAGGGNPNGN